jgi:hypothetical protein
MPITQDRMLAVLNVAELGLGQLQLVKNNLPRLEQTIDALASCRDLLSESTPQVPKSLVTFLQSSITSLIDIYQKAKKDLENDKLGKARILIALEREHFDKQAKSNKIARSRMRTKRKESKCSK